MILVNQQSHPGGHDFLEWRNLGGFARFLPKQPGVEQNNDPDRRGQIQNVTLLTSRRPALQMVGLSVGLSPAQSRRS